MLQDQYPAQTRILADEDATREAVLSALPGASMAHFACHGYSDPADPSSSRLLLGDGETLTVRDLSTVRLDNPDLAFLSACETAMSTEALADESINLAAAFQLAGFRHVIANLWPVADVMASKISAGFYAALNENGRPAADSAAIALHKVSRELRNQFPDDPSLWAATIHFGP